MTSSGSPGRRLRAAAMASAPSAPGVNTSTSAPAARRAGTSPAWTSEDLPDPDGPVTTSSGRLPQPGQARCDVGVAPEEGVAVAVAVRRESLPRAGRIGHPCLVVGRQAGVLGQDAGLQRDQLRAGSRPSPDRAPDGASGSRPRASACRPPRYCASASSAHRRSRNGCCPVSTVPSAATPAWSPAVEPGLQQVLLGGQPQLAEPDGLEASRHPVLQLPEGRAPPQGERVGQQRDRALRACG